VSDRVVCLDTSVYIKYLSPDEQSDAATGRIEAILAGDERLVAPSWAWAEVGSVLRKKVRQGLLQPDEAESLWTAFLDLPIEFVESPELRRRAWRLTDQHNLPTLYDASFLACTELLPTDSREFWTADDTFVAQLGASRPGYVHRLGA
jgi:predicted nucleic acid-binding protein